MTVLDPHLRLFRIEKIARAELWKGPDRKPVFGLRETAGNGAVNTMRETRETVRETAEILAGNAPTTHTVYKYIPGAALRADAPDPDELDWAVDEEETRR